MNSALPEAGVRHYIDDDTVSESNIRTEVYLLIQQMTTSMMMTTHRAMSTPINANVAGSSNDAAES